MASFHPYRPKNGSGKRSEFWSYHFSIRGKLIRGATGERDRGKAEIKAAEEFLKARKRANLPVPREAVAKLEQQTFEELGGAFVADVEDRIAKKRLVRSDRYARDMEYDLAYIRFEHVTHITSTSWRELLDELHEGYPEKKDSVSWRYLQRVTCTARALLRYANQRGFIENVPELAAPTMEDVALEQQLGQPMSPSDRDKFLATLDKVGRQTKDRKRAREARRALRIYVALLASNLRKSGLARLSLRQVKWNEKRIVLPPRKSKSKKERAIALHLLVARAIKEELRERGDISPDEPIFGTFDLRRRFKETCKLAGIDTTGLQPHHFTRHTTSTAAGNAGATLVQLMALGTWETPAMAMRYVKIDAERSREALDLVYAESRVKAVRKKRR